MGLDALVYLNKNNLEFDADREGARTEERTGEVYFEDPPHEHESKAIHKRLGNATTVAAIVEEISGAVKKQDLFLFSRVLYSAAHAGDVIELKDLDQLQQDLTLIEDTTRERRSKELAVFLADMSELIHEARKQKNPIVFV